MIRVAVCGNIALSDGGDLKAVLEQCARERDDYAQVVLFESPLELIDAMMRAIPDELIDMVIVCMGLSGMTGIEVARELYAFDKHVPVILCANGEDYAYDAMQAHVRDCLPNPVESGELARVVRACFDEVVRFQDQSTILRCRDRARRVPFEDFVFAETSNHDQVVHVTSGAKYEMRATSQILFERLSRDPRFFKAGSSCIINLDHVRAVRSGGSVVSLDNGYTCSVPVRLRKPFEEALMRKRG